MNKMNVLPYRRLVLKFVRIDGVRIIKIKNDHLSWRNKDLMHWNKEFQKKKVDYLQIHPSC